MNRPAAGRLTQGIARAPGPLRATVPLVSAILLFALGSVACGAQSMPPDSPTLTIATSYRDASMAALIVGTIRGTVNSDRTACFHLVEEPNVPMDWPLGYSARENPLRVVDGHGNTVAVDGQHVKLGGGIADLGSSQVILGCGEAKQVLAVG